MKLTAPNALPRLVSSDIRDSALFKEAESLFRRALKPGAGRPTSATDITISADGKHLACAGAMLEKLEGLPTARICLIDFERGDLKVATFGPNSDLGPKFSPAGGILAFRSDRMSVGDFQTYLLDLASGETRPAPVVSAGWVEYLEFSPDGSSLLLGIAGHGADVSGAQGAKTSKRIGAGGAVWMPAVETGDESFRRRSIWVLNLGDQSLQQVSPAHLNPWEACWCGNSVIAAVVSEGATEEDWYRARLASIDLETGNVKTLYQPKDQLEWLSGSPDGRSLAFVEAVCSDRWVCAGNLGIIDLQSGKVDQVGTHHVDVTFTKWRDGRRLIIAGIREFENVVAEFDAESRNVRELWASEELNCQGFFYPCVAPCPGDGDDFVIQASGHLIPPRVIHVGDKPARTIINFGHKDLDEIIQELRPVTPYMWKAPDGQEIQGWLMRGEGEKPAPLIMEVHGGPIFRWPQMLLTRSAYHAMLAARGYALFWPNPRGSSGRGQSFARAVVGDMGGADTNDYLSGLDQLVAQGIADPRRIGVMGGSYGGFMTSWLITQDQRFAAAIPVAPVTNWLSQHLTSNIPYFDALCLGSRFTDLTGTYYSRSPVLFADRVRTPTLNICGALDRCTPPSQAQEFHAALKEHGVESALVTYPQEGHGVRSFPGMIDYAARVVDWFDSHLTAPKSTHEIPSEMPCPWGTSHE
jgi:dipeptidyl aminopeptidase/acylaminoacyl peptidase